MGEDVEEREIVVADRRSLAQQLLGVQIGIGHREDGQQMFLPIELEIIVDATIKVWGELTDTQDRAGTHEVDGAVVRHQPTGQAEITIQPRVEQAATVDLHAHLLPPDVGRGRVGLELETRRVGVRPDDAESCFVTDVLRGDPRHDGSVAHDEPPACHLGPGLGLVHACEPGVLKSARQLGGGMVGGGGRLDEPDRVGDVIGEFLWSFGAGHALI